MLLQHRHTCMAVVCLVTPTAVVYVVIPTIDAAEPERWMDGRMDGCMYACAYTYAYNYVCKPGFGLRQPAGHNPKLLEPTPGLLCVSIPKTLMNLRHTRNSPVPNTFKTRRYIHPEPNAATCCPQSIPASFASFVTQSSFPLSELLEDVEFRGVGIGSGLKVYLEAKSNWQAGTWV